MEQQTEAVIIPKNEKRSVLTYWAGIPSALFSILFVYIAFSQDTQSKDLWTDLLGALAFGLVVVICIINNKRINAFLTSVLMFGLGSWMLSDLIKDTTQDFWVTLLWTIAFLIAGLSYLLRAFNTNMAQSVKRIKETKTFRVIAKTFFWVAIIAIGLLLITGIFSVLAGLSATTIIIILLIMIWLK